MIIYFMYQKERKEELIDTLWNVNNNGKLRRKKLIGINRYIMECKLYPSDKWTEQELQN